MDNLDKLTKLYSNLIKLINNRKDDFNEEFVSVFNYAKGSEYDNKEFDNKFLIVGRSVNGWTNYNKNELLLKEGEIINRIGNDNLQWTINNWGINYGKTYNTKRSAFWRINRKITDLVYQVSDYNFNKLSWTNLYKISNAAGGNPSPKLQALQFDLVKQILIEEIRILEPKYIVFLTGYDWAKPFLIENDNIKIELLNQTNYVKAKGSFFNSKFAVGLHPQGKLEMKHAEEILEYLDLKN
ncbi:MAG: hypothetical protein SFU91_06660 [Chloroherpetonaceae bacterium]|nr:hypothetical protein [Chloroherpetonaceae bacterium]